jgi:SAM domain (Sterile alpha motif)
LTREYKSLVQFWTKEDVVVWLEKNGFSDYKSIFYNNHIDGRTLPDLTDKELKDELAITDESAREEILKDIKLVKAMAWKTEKEAHMMHKTVLSFYEKNSYLFEGSGQRVSKKESDRN